MYKRQRFSFNTHSAEGHRDSKSFKQAYENLESKIVESNIDNPSKKLALDRLEESFDWICRAMTEDDILYVFTVEEARLLAEKRINERKESNNE